MTHTKTRPSTTKSAKNPLKDIPDSQIMVEAALRMGESLSKLLEPVEYSPQSQELKDWQAAITYATSKLNPSRKNLADLYKNLFNDTHLYSVVESRVLRVMRSKFRIVDQKTGKENPDLTALFQTPWFEKYTRLVMSSVAQGTTIIEVIDSDSEGHIRNVEMIPRSNIRPAQGLILKNYFDTEGWNYKEPPYSRYYIQVGEDNDLGLLAILAPIVIAKKFAIGAWSHFTEKYGIPFRWITTDSMDNSRIKTLNSILKLMAGAGYAVLGNNEKLEMQKVDGNHQNIFNDFIVRLNGEMSKGVLGQDGTSDNKDAKGTYGSLKIMQGVANDRHETDKTLLKNNINYELIPRLITNFGYPLANFRFEWSTTEDMDTKDFLQAIKDLGEMFELDPRQITEKTGINILGMKKADTDPQKKNSSPLARVTRPLYPEVISDPVALDESRIDDIQNRVLEDVFDNQKKFSPEYFNYVSRELTGALTAAWKDVPFGFSDIDQGVLTCMEANLFRFSAAKDTAMLSELNQILRNSSTFEDFKEKAVPVLGEYNKNYLRTEYNNAISAGTNGARYRQQLADSDILKYWQYKTAADAKVREAHRILHDKVMLATDPAWFRIYPINGHGCRCLVIALADKPRGYPVSKGDDLIKLLQQTGVDQNGVSEWDRMVKSGFDMNPGHDGRVFSNNNMYIKQFKASYSVTDMYGDSDKTWNNLNKVPLPFRSPKITTRKDADAWFGNLAGDKNYAPIKAYNDRTIHFTEDVYKGLVSGSRIETVEFVPEVLLTPDEIWLSGTGENGYVYSYIKFYDQDMIVVSVDIATDQPMKVKTMNKATTDISRKGLLIKRYDNE